MSDATKERNAERRRARPAQPDAGEPLQDIDRLAFDDNRLLAELSGAHDRHLALLEDMIGVRIDPRGNELAVSGGPAARARATSALRALYARLGQGLPVGAEDVRAAAALSAERAAQRPAQRSDKRSAQENTPHAAASPEGDEEDVVTQTIKTPRRLIAARTRAQGRYLTALRDGELVFGVGPAGTGKTYLAVAHAVSLLQSGAVERLVLSRPAIEAGERIGFLPGDMKEKVDPYLRPLYDALHDMLHADYVERRIAAGDIEIAPLAFMRGRTLSRAAIILDEAQNATIAQTKMFLTRLGEGARMVLTGDPSQSDLPRGEPSGLADALTLLGDVRGVRVSRFAREDVVRHPLVARIIERYEARE